MVMVMAEVTVRDDRLVVMIHGLDVLWTFRSRLVVPLAHVRGARIDPHLESEGPWLGAGRTDALLDYAVAAGPMIVHGRHEFWDVHHPDRAVAIDLEHEPFTRLVLEVEDREAVITTVNAAVEAARAAAGAA
jgi:hypothetical protein